MEKESFYHQIYINASFERGLLSIISKIDIEEPNRSRWKNNNWLPAIKGNDPIVWCVINHKTIEGLDPIEWAIKNTQMIEGQDPIIWLRTKQNSIGNPSSNLSMLAGNCSPVI